MHASAASTIIHLLVECTKYSNVTSYYIHGTCNRLMIWEGKLIGRYLRSFWWIK